MVTSSNLELLIKKMDAFVKVIATIIVIFSALTFAAHAQTRLTVVDTEGQPLADAVVWVADEHLDVAARTEPQSVDVDQIDRQFSPFMTVIRRGSQVTFPNSDNIRHHVYSFSEPKPFEIKLYANEERPTLSFDKAGLVTLGCNIHDQMIAHIVITDGASGWTSAANGVVTLPLQESESPVTVRVWHPWLGADLAEAISVQLQPGEAKSIILPVTRPAPETEQKSRLQQRFNRTGAS